MDRYFLVDVATKTLLNGPLLWDGHTSWDTGGATLLPEAQALAEGYHWPVQDIPDDPGQEG